MKTSYLLMVSFALILSGTSYAYAASQSVIVEPNDSERLSFSLKTGDKIQFQINVDGGSNDDIVLKIRNPTGGSLGDGRIIEYYGDTITAQESGTYVFEFDNDMSVISSKRVDFSYDIIKRPVPQAIANTASEAIGGCLIATATYDTELAPQVQFLREVRDNVVMSTSSGIAFMSGFNTLYYSFAPAIADAQREYPLFNESVKLFITPMISSLSIMSLADTNSEIDVLGFGISIIALNLGMYVVAPATVVWQIKKRF